MTSYTRINVNTSHLIPAAAVWKSPEIIKSLVYSLFQLSFLLAVLAITGHTLKEGPIFNKTQRIIQAKYESCISKFILDNPRYTNNAMFYASKQCYAAAMNSTARPETR